MLEYAYTYRGRQHRRRYNLPAFQALFVTGGDALTRGEDRVQSFITAFQKHIRPLDLSRPDTGDRSRRPPYDLFLFTHDARLDQYGTDILSLPWLNGRGDRRTLLD